MGSDDDAEWLELKSVDGINSGKSGSSSPGSSWFCASAPGGVGLYRAPPAVELVLTFEPSSPWEGVEVKRRKITPLAGAVDQPLSRAPMVTVTLKDFPNLVEHLAACRYDDGMPRRPGRLFLETLGVSWLVVLKEPDEALEMRCIGASLDDALALAELMLGADDPPWVPDEWAKKRSGDSKKK